MGLFVGKRVYKRGWFGAGGRGEQRVALGGCAKMCRGGSSRADRDRWGWVEKRDVHVVGKICSYGYVLTVKLREQLSREISKALGEGGEGKLT